MKSEKASTKNKKGTTKKAVKKTSTKNVATKKTTAKKDNLRKKELKAKVEIKNQDVVEQTNEFVRLLKIIAIVTAIFLVFYLVTIVVTKKADETKNSTEKKTVEKAVIQYEDIIIGTMLNYDGTYYVFIKDEEDTRLDEYDSLIKTAKENQDAPYIYQANLTDAFNKIYLGKEENYYVADMQDFKVKGTTLVKVVDHKIDSVYDNADAIKNKLNELS